MLIFARGRRVVVLSALALAAGCGGSPPDAVESGTEVTIEMPDGSLVTGRVVEPADEEVPSDFGSTPDQGAGTGSESAQSTRSLGEPPSTALTSATGTSPAGSPALPGASDSTAGGPDSTQAAPDSTHQASDSTAGAPDSIQGRTVDSSTNANLSPARLVPPEPPGDEPEYREISVRAGTRLSLVLEGALASDVNRLEDPVRARVTRAVMVDGVEAIPEGSTVHGTVTAVEASGKVSGRARLSFRFDRLDIDPEQYEIRTERVSYEAEGTKTDDAKKIGIGAGAGAVIGGLFGGGRGARTGAAIGGGAGTAVVLTSGGDEIELRTGTSLEVDLAETLIREVRNY